MRNSPKIEDMTFFRIKKDRVPLISRPLRRFATKGHEKCGLVSALLVLTAAATCLGAASRSNSPENERAYAEYAAGVYAEANDENELAMQHYRRAASDLPQSAEVAARLGTLCLRTNSPQEAQRYLVRAVDLAPDNMELKIHAAKACALAGSPRKGIEYLEEVIRHTPAWTDGYHQVAELYKHLGMWASAADAYARMARIPGMRHEAYERLGDMYLVLGQRYARLHRFYKQMIHFQRALRWFDKVAPPVSKRQSVLLSRAKCYKGTYQFDKAAEQCEKYLAARPNDVAARRFLAQIQRQNGDIEKAALTYGEMVRANPRFFRAHIELVDTLLEGDYLRQAVIAAENFADKFPEEISSNFLAGRCLVLAGYHARAQGYLEKAVELEADFKTKDGKSAYGITLKKTMFLLGMVHLHSGGDEKAMQYFGRTLELDPEDANANNNLGYLTIENNGDLQNALRLIRRAVRIQPRCGEFLDSLGWVYFKMGRNEEAIATLKDALQLRPQPEIYDHLGRVYQSMGQILKARKEWKKALQVDLEYRPARNRLKESYDLEERI